MMNSFQDRLRNSERNISPLMAGITLSNQKDTWLTFEKVTNLVGAQVPHLSNFRDGIVPLDVD